jgi:hypothetical protein
MIDNNLFFCNNKDVYPPFKNGLYLEEYFISKFNSNLPITKRTYIPFPWTNFQIEHWFQSRKTEMQTQLDEWVGKNKNDDGYFTIVQYDDGCLLNLPKNTIVYGCCSGNIPIPLIYEDRNNMLISKKIDKTFEQKRILCSFVGTLTHHLRNTMINVLKNESDFVFQTDPNWTPIVSSDKQNKFVEMTCNSKFVLCPRGYGRNSFRLYEVLKLGSIPIYVWDDIEWLPYKGDNEVSYEKFCISINIKDIHKLKTLLSGIDCHKYNEMMSEYNKIQHLFTLDGLYDYIISKNNL